MSIQSGHWNIVTKWTVALDEGIVKIQMITARDWPLDSLSVDCITIVAILIEHSVTTYVQKVKTIFDVTQPCLPYLTYTPATLDIR